MAISVDGNSKPKVTVQRQEQPYKLTITDENYVAYRYDTLATDAKDATIKLMKLISAIEANHTIMSLCIEPRRE